MSRVVAIISVAAILAAVPAFAQEAAPGPGTVEVTLIPGGATFFTSKDDGARVRELHVRRRGGAQLQSVTQSEGEAGGTVGIARDLTFRGSTGSLKTPNTLTYNGNVVLDVATGRSVVPFVTGGVGGLTMFERTELSINDTQTLLTGSAGSGVKSYTPTAVGDCVPTTVSSPCDPRTTLRTFLVRTRGTGIVSTERSSSTRCDNSRPLEREREFECALTLVAGSDEHELWLAPR